MATTNYDIQELLTPAEAAKLFHVDVRTVTRWARLGYLTVHRTVGNHRRYERKECEDLRNGVTVPTKK